MRERPLREEGVDANEPLGQRVHAEPKGLQSLGAEQRRRSVWREKGQDGALSAFEPHPDLGDLPDRFLARREDDGLTVDRLVPERNQQAPRKGEIRGSGVHENPASPRGASVGRQHFYLDVEQSHGAR